MPTRRLIVTASVLLLASSRVDAHALGVECKLVGGRVELEAYYDDDTPARQARVRVLDAGKKVVAEGRTDEHGKWSFRQPVPGRYEVTVDAGAGHRQTTVLTVPAGLPAPAPESASAQTPVRVSEGPGREEATRTPWPRLLVGLLVIAAASALFLLVSAFRKGQRNGRASRGP